MGEKQVRFACFLGGLLVGVLFIVLLLSMKPVLIESVTRPIAARTGTPIIRAGQVWEDHNPDPFATPASRRYYVVAVKNGYVQYKYAPDDAQAYSMATMIFLACDAKLVRDSDEKGGK